MRRLRILGPLLVVVLGILVLFWPYRSRIRQELPAADEKGPATGSGVEAGTGSAPRKQPEDSVAFPGRAVDNRLYLLDVGKNQKFSDIGSDDKSTQDSQDSKELGGKAIRVVFSPGDTAGDRAAKVKNWQPFATFGFDAFNPGKQGFTLSLHVFHAGTTNYPTRAVVPVKFEPGVNEIRIATSSIANVNGSVPNLASVRKWFFADEAKAGPTVFFGSIWLQSDQKYLASSVVAPTGGTHGLVGYTVKGKVGTLDVNLTLTPFAVSPPSAPEKALGPKVHGDPARLERIRKARMPKISRPILFNTPEADACCSALEVFPADNPWNLVVEDWPLHANSKNIIASIGATKRFRTNQDMGFVLVPPDQAKVPVRIMDYPGESDKGPFPVPDDTPIEGWPLSYNGASLAEVQRKVEEGDRHAIVVDPTNRILYEFYQMRKTAKGWQAAQASVFDLKSNALRPDGWTSSDAAGLPIFPAVVRYDELKRGVVEHALRVTVKNTRRAYVYPATHFASKKTDVNLPRMGERIRLRKDFDTSGFSREAQTILVALKKYGMFVADNGIDWAISVSPDARIKALHEEMRKMQGSAFEVVTPPAGYEPPQK